MAQDALDHSLSATEQPTFRRQWWQRPQLRTDEDEHRERRVTWLELFYDLVFVVVIAEVAHYLSEHVSLGGVLGYILLFLPVWWVWIGGTYYAERFETEDLSYRVFVFLQMLPTAALAVFAYNGLGETAEEFALSYAAARSVITMLWWRGGLYNPRARPVTNRFTVGFITSIVLFVVSVWVPAPWRFVLWGVGLFIDLFTPTLTLRAQARLPRLSTSRLPERYGLFMIIVLGEAVVGVVSGVAEQEPFTPQAGLTGALGMGLAFGLWWVYFDFVARRRARPNIWSTFSWSYLHLPLAMAVAALGAAVLNVLASEGFGLPNNLRWLLCGAVAAALMVMALLELTLRRDPDEPTTLHISVPLKFGAAALALLVAALGGSLGPLPVLGLLLLLVFTQMIYGAYVWFHTQPVSPTLAMERSETAQAS